MSDSPSTRPAEQSETDAALLLRVQNRDHHALTTLFTRHSRLVFSVGMRVLADREDAEDVLQEVFMQIWTRPLAVNEAHQSAGPLLAVMARNRAVDHLRRRRPVQPIDSLDLPSLHDLASSAERGLLIDRIRNIAAALSAEQQIALDLAFFQGLTHSEIAEQTSTPLGTVKTRIRAALQLLERTLKP